MPPDEKDIQKYVLNTQRGSTQGVARRDALHRHRCSEAVSPTNMGHISLCSDGGKLACAFRGLPCTSPVRVFFIWMHMCVLCFPIFHKLFAVYKICIQKSVILWLIYFAHSPELSYLPLLTRRRSLQLNPGYQLPTSLPGCHHTPSDAPRRQLECSSSITPRARASTSAQFCGRLGTPSS